MVLPPRGVQAAGPPTGEHIECGADGDLGQGVQIPTVGKDVRTELPLPMRQCVCVGGGGLDVAAGGGMSFSGPMA